MTPQPHDEGFVIISGRTYCPSRGTAARAARARAPSHRQSARFHCTVMYSPYSHDAHTMNLSQAEEFLGSSITPAGSTGAWRWVSNKYTFYLDDPGTLGQSLVVDVTHSSEVGVDALILAYVRSWNTSMMGSVQCWLSCSRGPDISVDSRTLTPKQVLNGDWSLSSTQADSTQIWPLDARRESLSHFHTHGRRPQCALRYLHIVHHTRGGFRLIGLMYA